MTVNPYFYATFHASFTHCQTTKYIYIFIYVYMYIYITQYINATQDQTEFEGLK